MRRCLVVAHQTVGSPALLDALRDELAAGPCTFHLVVPEYHGGQGLTWTEGRARADAERQLESARLRFAAEGIPITGEVGDASPVEAVAIVLRREGEDVFDKIIVSTLPHGISKWLHMDAPSRIQRTTGLPVRHVVAQPATVSTE